MQHWIRQLQILELTPTTVSKTLPSRLSVLLASVCVHSFQQSPSYQTSGSISLEAPRERTTKPTREDSPPVLSTTKKTDPRTRPRSNSTPLVSWATALLASQAGPQCSSGPAPPRSRDLPHWVHLSFIPRDVPATGSFPSSLKHVLSLFIKK